jgi:hypothetical protein
MGVASKAGTVGGVVIMRIRVVTKTALFSLASVLLQLLGFVYLVQLDSNQSPQEKFLLLLAANAVVAYLCLMLVAVGNWLPEGAFGRLQELFWSICKVGFFSALGLASIIIWLYIVGNMVNALVHIIETPAK